MLSSSLLLCKHVWREYSLLNNICRNSCYWTIMKLTLLTTNYSWNSKRDFIHRNEYGGQVDYYNRALPSACSLILLQIIVTQANWACCQKWLNSYLSSAESVKFTWNLSQKLWTRVTAMSSWLRKVLYLMEDVEIRLFASVWRSSNITYIMHTRTHTAITIELLCQKQYSDTPYWRQYCSKAVVHNFTSSSTARPTTRQLNIRRKTYLEWTINIETGENKLPYSMLEPVRNVHIILRVISAKYML